MGTRTTPRHVEPLDPPGDRRRVDRSYTDGARELASRAGDFHKVRVSLKSGETITTVLRETALDGYETIESWIEERVNTQGRVWIGAAYITAAAIDAVEIL